MPMGGINEWRLQSPMTDEGGEGGGGEAPAADPPAGEGSGFDPSVLEGKTPAELLSDPDLRQNPTISGYRTLDDLAKSHVSLEKMLGQKDRLLTLPTENSSDEERAEFYAKLGRPDEPAGYSLSDPELPEGIPEANKDLVEGFRAKAHEAGLSTDQANALYSWFRQTEAGALTQTKEQREQAAREATEALRFEWGSAFDSKLQVAEDALSDQPEEFVDFLKQNGLNNHPQMVRLLAQLGEARQEDAPRNSGAGAGPMTPDQAKAEINRLRGDESFSKAWMDQQHPGHQDAIKKLERLYQEAYRGR